MKTYWNGQELDCEEYGMDEKNVVSIEEADKCAN